MQYNVLCVCVKEGQDSGGFPFLAVVLCDQCTPPHLHFHHSHKHTHAHTLSLSRFSVWTRSGGTHSSCVVIHAGTGKVVGRSEGPSTNYYLVGATSVCRAVRQMVLVRMCVCVSCVMFALQYPHNTQHTTYNIQQTDDLLHPSTRMLCRMRIFLKGLVYMPWGWLCPEAKRHVFAWL
jgi:hypothetical protein